MSSQSDVPSEDRTGKRDSICSEEPALSSAADCKMFVTYFFVLSMLRKVDTRLGSWS